jgi:thioredoxin-related protein
MKTTFAGLVTLLIALGVQAGPVDWEHNFERALQHAQKNKKLVMVDLYTDWCGWCKKLDREVYKDKKVEETLAKHFVSVKINPEATASGAKLARQFGTRGFPHIVFTDATGKKIDEIIGYVPADAFLKRLEKLTVAPAK